jgi:DNA-directed RNA polymerase subunit RPC12/RpoP
MDGFKHAYPELHSSEGGDGYSVRCICGHIYVIQVDSDARCPECDSRTRPSRRVRIETTGVTCRDDGGAHRPLHRRGHRHRR